MPYIPLSKLPSAIYEVIIVFRGQTLKVLQLGYGITAQDQTADAKARTLKDYPGAEFKRATFWG